MNCRQPFDDDGPTDPLLDEVVRRAWNSGKPVEGSRDNSGNVTIREIDDDGPACRLTGQGNLQWPDDGPSGPPPKNPGRWAAVILLGVIVVAGCIGLAWVAMGGGV